MASSINQTNNLNWFELDQHLQTLQQKIEKYFSDKGEKVDVICPIHRTGGIIGGILGIRMHVLPILPTQFKYFYNPTRIEQISTLPDFLIDIPDNPNILFCEGNTSAGSISTQAAKLIKEKYPNAKLYLATVCKVFGGPEKLENIEEIFYGTMTNEAFKATPQDIEKYSLREGITIFPWENAEDELAEINNA